MADYQVRAHKITATKIAQVLPLRNSAGPMSPDAGLLLALENGSKHKWIIEDGAIPVVGAFLVQDADLHSHYIVSAEKFAELFTEIAD
jgi:hypothetical protein